MAQRGSATLEGGDVDVSEIPWVQSPSGSSNKFSIYPSSIANKGISLTTAGTNPPSSLEVITDESSPTPLKPSEFSSLQVTANQLRSLTPVVGIGTKQRDIPHIAVDEFSRQLTLQGGTSQVDIAQMSARQVDRLQVNPTQVTGVQDNISKVSLPSFISHEKYSRINNFGEVISNTPVWHNSIAENNPFIRFDISQIGIPQVSTDKFSIGQIGTSQVSTPQINTGQVSTPQIGFSEISTTQVDINQRSKQITPKHVGTTEVSINQVDIAESRLLQIGTTEINVHQTSTVNRSIPQINPTKISLSSSVTSQQLFSRSMPSQELLDIHTLTPESITTINSTAQNLWNTLLAPQTPFGINLQLTLRQTQGIASSLASCQLAEAVVTIARDRRYNRS